MPEVKAKITRLGHLGDGIAEGPIYVPDVLPGEIVTGTLASDRLASVKIVEPSAQRVRPPCRHAKSCGGCALQHASDAFVSDWKKSVVVQALQAHGIDAKIAEIVTSPSNSRRRAVFHGSRTKKGEMVGFFGRGTNALVDTPNCLLLDPHIAAALPILRELTKIGASRKSVIRLTVTATDGGLDICVDEARAADMDLQVSLSELAGRRDLARLTWNGETIAQARRPFVQMGRAKVTPPPAAFLQATRDGANALVASVLASAKTSRRVVDLFSGCGTFALPLSEITEVHAVEGLSELLAAAQTGWREAGGLHRMTTEKRDLFSRPLVALELDKFDMAVIDPPRAGAENQMKEVAQSNLKRVVSVSCNPVTFARDATILVGAGFQMGAITLVDQFRWSTHIEMVAEFRR
jgi:23S rRNA (uracil1939-C5)-methyltransferase